VVLFSFLVLAARLMGEAPGSRGWAASYDPVAVPEALFVTGAVRPGEGAEPAAAPIAERGRNAFRNLQTGDL